MLAETGKRGSGGESLHPLNRIAFEFNKICEFSNIVLRDEVHYFRPKSLGIILFRIVRFVLQSLRFTVRAGKRFFGPTRLVDVLDELLENVTRIHSDTGNRLVKVSETGVSCLELPSHICPSALRVRIGFRVFCHLLLPGLCERRSENSLFLLRSRKNVLCTIGQSLSRVFSFLSGLLIFIYSFKLSFNCSKDTIHLGHHGALPVLLEIVRKPDVIFVHTVRYFFIRC